ncbi:MULTISPECIES: abortive infection family protein [unclassified Xanthobacter]|uniref:abortive infection family protein n=1 Tax=unclassified Xanthobacter TaxID=2623496 RepID=UPI001F246A1E|nr:MULTISPECIES: abortive infection family protein [unclassified Xanthobacter]
MSTIAAMVKELREALASAIAEAKAYDVPALCVRLRLADGGEDEAFGSKYKYAHKRLMALSPGELAAAARLYADEHEHFFVSEQLAKLDEVSGPEITSLTRRRILAIFQDVPVALDIDEIELLRRLWPINSMPAPSSREDRTMEEYLTRQAFQCDRIEPAHLEAIGLLKCSRALFCRFLEAVTSPEARTGSPQAETAGRIDELLRHDGFTLLQAGRISGCPIYRVLPLPVGTPADESISAALAAFDPTQVHARWTAAMARRGTEPAGAITLARTLLEDVCKWILDQAGSTWQETDDLPVLYRKLSKVLKLAPDDHTEQIFKQILGSCQSVVESLGALRNKLSDAHSPGPKRARPQPRHAELAVNLAGAMATFLVATWEARQAESEASASN